MDVLLRVLDLFDALGIPHMVGGSLASSIHGEPRATRDADIVADVERRHAPRIVEALGEDYYSDESMILDAVSRRSSFNVIHRSGFKVDVYVLPDRTWDRVAFERRMTVAYPGVTGRVIPVRTPEDIVLKKLEWFRLGGEVSERQWRDVIGVIRVQGEALDRAYLERWARELRVDDLLVRATAEAGGTGPA